MARRFTEKLADLVWDRVDQQTDDGILEIISECEKLTTTNCGWVAYTLRDLVVAISRNILQLRQDATERGPMKEIENVGQKE